MHAGNILHALYTFILHVQTLNINPNRTNMMTPLHTDKDTHATEATLMSNVSTVGAYEDMSRKRSRIFGALQNLAYHSRENPAGTANTQVPRIQIPGSPDQHPQPHKKQKGPKS
jgi:hypothetical protein